MLSEQLMDDSELVSALNRADRALQRIERALSNRRPTPARDDELRAKVREVVEELDELIRQAAA
jgi:hypothetical protein